MTIDHTKATYKDCNFEFARVSVFLYADDILLIVISVNALQTIEYLY